ncbi:hypothetical protein GCM10029964_017480 [Kibdelosporangium lantanae]
MPNLVTRIPETLQSIRILRRAGLVPIPRFDEGIRALLYVKQIGPVAGAVRMSAKRGPHRPGLVDERGPLTFAQLEHRSNALARAWSERGLHEGSVVGVLCRDHRGLVDAMLAASKLGARILMMNTGFAKPQFVDVVTREKVSALVYDEEFTGLLADVDLPATWGGSRTGRPAATSPPSKSSSRARTTAPCRTRPNRAAWSC